jgi:hypothetical protein
VGWHAQQDHGASSGGGDLRQDPELKHHRTEDHATAHAHQPCQHASYERLYQAACTTMAVPRHIALEQRRRVVSTHGTCC